MTLRIGISGLRGTVDAQERRLTAAVVTQWSQAFVARAASESGRRPLLALGHDARRSSPAISALVRGALLLAGADLLDLGLTLTPTVQLAIRSDARIDGGVMVTASHNPIIWNGLKFLDAQGFFIPPDWWEEMRERIEANTLPIVPLDEVGTVERAGDRMWEAHLARTIAALPVEEIRQQRYRVALDCCNGGAVRWAELLQSLDCEPVLLHSEQHGFFAREAEPLPAHLDGLRHLVRSAGCDVGLAADPDGDRLVLVDARGEAVSEEHTVVLAAMALAREPDDRVVVNVVTTHALEEAVPHARVLRTAVGEMNVVEATVASGAVLGGEGSGGIIIPGINLARDGMAAAGIVLALMATEKAPLHELVQRIPLWDATKAKLLATAGTPDLLRLLFARWASAPPQVQVTDFVLRAYNDEGALTLALNPGGALRLSIQLPGEGEMHASGDGSGLRPCFAQLQQQTEPLHVDLTDGVKVVGDKVWLSLRPSNTEPIVRVMAEVRG